MLLNQIAEGKMKQETAEQAFLRYTSLKKSNADPKTLANVLSLANTLMDEKFKLKKRDWESQFAGTDWWEVVKKMYKVEEQGNKWVVTSNATDWKGNKWVVTSNATDWKQTKDWEFDTKYQAVEQLEKLIGYKAADRKKGIGSEDKDYARVDKLTKGKTE